MDHIIIWFIIGTLHLIVLTIQDFKNKHWVDSRHNYLMTGLTLGLFTTQKDLNILFFIGTVILTGILYSILKKKNFVGEGDTQAITWLFMGLCFIGTYSLVIFFGTLALQILIVTGIIKILKKKYSKNEGITKLSAPFFFCILVSFILTFVLGML